ncbi:PREDICTED: LOW QUALITY PROTEIN: INO80 complex subunit D-like [Branchiostoma belcheri]|uniref:LOW QUALITY PROTEIN: INO80 complex subunit D-like n=1 Tax=Branchiostoma belcheri TaxID=7741 RepID=A0A6P4ZMC3_BRABE|nr:PREDICTED: LOW QUALITY PROTEIN: INO80 complex subunit D-like [Branchiostoma belcheri]
MTEATLVQHGPSSNRNEAPATSMYQGKHIHYSEVDNKPLCSYSPKLCKQRRLNGYAFCIRHVLEDRSAPFKQCEFVAKYNNQRCTNPIPKSQDRNYCNSHLQVMGLAPKKERRKTSKEKVKKESDNLLHVGNFPAWDPVMPPVPPITIKQEPPDEPVFRKPDPPAKGKSVKSRLHNKITQNRLKKEDLNCHQLPSFSSSHMAVPPPSPHLSLHPFHTSMMPFHSSLPPSPMSYPLPPPYIPPTVPFMATRPRKPTKCVRKYLHEARRSEVRRLMKLLQCREEARVDLFSLIESSDSEDESHDSLPWQHSWFSDDSEEEDSSDSVDASPVRPRDKRLVTVHRGLCRKYAQLLQSLRRSADKQALNQQESRAVLGSYGSDRRETVEVLREESRHRDSVAVRHSHRPSVRRRDVGVSRVCTGDWEGQKCTRRALPLTRFCVQHVGANPDQLLYQRCTARFSDGRQCSTTVFDIAHERPLCLEHARKRELSQKREADRKAAAALAAQHGPPPKKPRKKSKSSHSRSSKKSKSKKKRNSRPQKPIPPAKPVGNNDISLSLGIDTSALSPAPEGIDPDDITEDLQELDGHDIEKSLELDIDDTDLNIDNVQSALEGTHHAPGLLESHDFADVLPKLPEDLEGFDFFTGKNGEFVPTREEAEELERALEAANDVVKKLQSNNELPSLIMQADGQDNHMTGHMISQGSGLMDHGSLSQSTPALDVGSLMNNDLGNSDLHIRDSGLNSFDLENPVSLALVSPSLNTNQGMFQQGQLNNGVPSPNDASRRGQVDNQSPIMMSHIPTSSQGSPYNNDQRLLGNNGHYGNDLASLPTSTEVGTQRPPWSSLTPSERNMLLGAAGQQILNTAVGQQLVNAGMFSLPVSSQGIGSKYPTSVTLGPTADPMMLKQQLEGERLPEHLYSQLQQALNMNMNMAHNNTEKNTESGDAILNNYSSSGVTFPANGQ